MSSSVQKIKERLSIVDVISSYLPVIEAGKNFKARCPFHNEKTPSFFISPERETYYCFGCGEKGDIFSFVEKFEGIDFLGALKILADRAGVVLDYDKKDNKDDKQIYYEILEEATKFFELNFEKNDKPKAYLIGRGILDESIKNFRIGYVKDEWRSLSDYLISKGYKIADIETVGLIKKSDKGFYDRFRSRIIFPISDSSGRIIGFTGRIFGKDDKEEAKYLNSPDTPLFNKSNILFGIDKAKLAIRKRGYSIVVEGQMDLILSHQSGFTNTVAVSGTAFTDSLNDSESNINNLGLIKRISPNIIFAYDGDSAGIRATSRSAMIALSLDMQVKIAVLPEGKDPADVIKDNIEEWKDIIKNSKDIINFHLDRICNKTNDIKQRGKLVREVIFPFLAVIKSSIDKSSYLSIINSKTSIPISALSEDFDIYIKNNVTREQKIDILEKEVSKNTISRKDNLLKRFFSILFYGDKNNLNIKQDDILNILIEKIGVDDVLKMKEYHESYKDMLILESEMWYGDKTKDLQKDLEEIILNIEEEILKERLIDIADKINRSDGEEKELLLNYKKIVERIANIKDNRLK